MPVRIRAAEVFVVRMPLRIAIRHAAAERRANTTVFLVVEAADGTLGIGEGLAREYVTGESTEDCVRYLSDVAARLPGLTSGDPDELLTRSGAEGPAPAAAACALELAVLDLWSKCTDTPLSAALPWAGAPRAGAPAQGTLTFSAVYPLLSPRKLAALHLFYRSLMRMEDLKVKGTGAISTDLDTVRRIRRAYSYPVRIRVDLNGSLRHADAEEYFRGLLQAGVTWVEQPFPRDDWDDHQRFQRAFGRELTLCGDESLRSALDVREAARRGAFRAVNIRVAKHGGIRKSLEVYMAARETGLEAQLGALVGETSVLAYAGLHLASLSGPMAHHEGCFGKYILTRDVVRPSLSFGRGGRVSLAALPPVGLVPAVDLRALRGRALRAQRFPAA